MAFVKVKSVTPPSGLRRFLFRLPIWLFKARLGWLFGRRLLLLYHTGRKSGQFRQTVLEVIRYDRSNKTYYLKSGYGDKADWYKNLMAAPDARIMVGLRQIDVVATRIPSAKAEEMLLDYWRENPMIFKHITTPLLGYKGDATEKGVRGLAEHIPIFSLTVCTATK